MKKWLLVPFMACMITLQAEAAKKAAPAKTSDSLFITHEQFLQLTPAEKRSYIRQLKQIIVDLSVAFPEMAQEISIRSSLFAQILGNEAIAQDAQVVAKPVPARPPGATNTVIQKFVSHLSARASAYSTAISNMKTTNLSEEDKKNLGENYVQSLYWISQAVSNAKSMSKETPEEEALKKKVLQDLQRHIKNVQDNEAKVKKFVDEYVYKEARDKYFKQALSETGLPTTAAYPLSMVPYNPKTGRPSTEEQVAPSKQTPVKAVGTAPAAEAKTADKGDGSEATKYRCMYSGFIVKTLRCRPPEKLPWDLADIDENTFICNNGTIMCNPLLFGVKTDCDFSAENFSKEDRSKCFASSKPLCVRIGVSATKNCLSSSNNNNGLMIAIAIIEQNAKVFNEYGKTFAELCGENNEERINFNAYRGQRKEATMRDIRATCQVARIRLEELRSKYNSDSKKAAPADAPVPVDEGVR